jgi:hypothetical protein
MEVSIIFPKNVANLGVIFLRSFLEFAGCFFFPVAKGVKFRKTRKKSVLEDPDLV